MKCQGFVSHLERAKSRMAPGFVETSLSLRWAHSSMLKIIEAKAEYFFARDGWLYVISICEELGQSLYNAERSDLADICRSIYDWALKNEDAIDGRGILSTVRSVLEKSPSSAMSILKEKADRGDAEANFLLAEAYAENDAPDGDLIEAFARVIVAERLGYAQTSPLFQNLKMRLTEEQQVAADCRHAEILFAIPPRKR